MLAVCCQRFPKQSPGNSLYLYRREWAFGQIQLQRVRRFDREMFSRSHFPKQSAHWRNFWRRRRAQEEDSEGRELANQIIATWHRLISLEVWQVGPDAFTCESSASRVQHFCRLLCGWNGMQEDKASSISGLDEWSNSIWNIFANNLIYFIITKMQFV